MRLKLVLLSIALLAGQGWAAEPADMLSTERGALVAPGTPPAVTAYLQTAWGALVCVPAPHADTACGTDGLLPPLLLPALPADSGAAVDSLRAWRLRYGLSVCISDSAGPAAFTGAAETAGFVVFRLRSDFAAGDIAIPRGDGYLFYRGPQSTFFGSGPGRLERLVEQARQGTALTKGERTLVEAAAMLGAARLERVDTGPGWIETLVTAVQEAEAVAGSADSAAPLAALYARRWGHVLAAQLAPVAVDPGFELYAGVPQARTITLRSGAPVPIRIRGAHTLAGAPVIDWQTEFPAELPAGGRLLLAGRIRAATPDSGVLELILECRYGDFAFPAHLLIDAPILPPVALAFEPPILYAAEGTERPDPDYLIRIAPGELEVVNRAGVPVSLALEWSADNPLSIAATERQLDLSAGERRRLAYTLSVPKELRRGAYTFGARATNAQGLDLKAEGQIWDVRPKAKDGLQVGVIGGSVGWLAGLRAVGIPAYPLVGQALASADLTPLDAVVVPAGTEPYAAATAAVHDLARAGRIVLVELSPAGTAWLPWPTPVIQRPGPFAASFYDPDLSWWAAPNQLVGGCFAALADAPAYTLPAGITGWEPLLVDDGGKGFMYRRASGRGWFVVIHSAWATRLDALDRRALLGLINLVSQGHP